MILNDALFPDTWAYAVQDQDTFVISPRYLTEDSTETGTPLSIGLTVASYPVGDTILTLSTDAVLDGVLTILAPPDTNKLHIEIPANKMAMLSPGSYSFKAFSQPSDPNQSISLGVVLVCIGQVPVGVPS